MTDLAALLLLAADGATVAAPASSWLSPEGLNAILILLGLVAAVVGRLTGKQAEAKKAADLLTLARGYTATVKGVQSFRELATPEQASRLLSMIESATKAEGVAAEHHAAVHAITEGAAPLPVTVAGVVEKLATSDPLAAVRAATARLGVRRIA